MMDDEEDDEGEGEEESPLEMCVHAASPKGEVCLCLPHLEGNGNALVEVSSRSPGRPVRTNEIRGGNAGKIVGEERRSFLAKASMSLNDKGSEVATECRCAGAMLRDLRSLSILKNRNRTTIAVKSRRSSDIANLNINVSAEAGGVASVMNLEVSARTRVIFMRVKKRILSANRRARITDHIRQDSADLVVRNSASSLLAKSEMGALGIAVEGGGVGTNTVMRKSDEDRAEEAV